MVVSVISTRTMTQPSKSTYFVYKQSYDIITKLQDFFLKIFPSSQNSIQSHHIIVYENICILVIKILCVYYSLLINIIFYHLLIYVLI